MKKLLIPCILLICLPLFSSCEKRILSFPATFSRTEIFTLDEAGGAFSESSTITADDIRNALDLPDDADITSVNIEALSASVELLEANEASTITVSGSIDEIGGSQDFMFQNYVIPLDGIIGLNTPFIGVNPLIAAGISKLKTKIESFLLGLGSQQSFDVAVSGTSSPGGARVAVQLYLKIQMSMEYKICVDVAKDFVEGGEKCEDEPE